MSLPISEFADKLTEVIPVMMREFIRRQPPEFLKGHISPPQFFVMDFLNKNGQSKMTDLARFMGVSTAAMTGLVERLVKYNYAMRIYDDKDRRIVKIGLTPKGGGLIKKIINERQKMIIEVFGKISQRERDEYLRILIRIRDLLTADKKSK